MNVYYVFSEDPWNKMESLVAGVSPSLSKVAQPTLLWNEFPVLMTKSEAETIDMKLVSPIINGTSLIPSRGALLNGELPYSLELIDRIFLEAIRNYQKELLKCSLKDRENLVVEEAVKEKLVIESKSLEEGVKGYLRRACTHRIGWLQTIEISEKERLKNTNEIILGRCEALSSKISPLEEEGLVDIEDLEELKQLYKVNYYIFNTSVLFRKRPLIEFLKDHFEENLEAELSEINLPLKNEIEQSLCIQIAEHYHSAISLTETKIENIEGVGEHNEITSLRQKAEEGDAISMYNLGYCLLNGDNIIRNPEEAMHWFLKASERNILQAVYSIGLLYDSRMELDEFVNDDEAFLWYERAALKDFAPAQYMVGNFYELGIAVNKDINQACEWYTKALQQNDRNAQYALACINEERKREWRKSFKLFLSAANQGHAQAQEKVGNYYKQGKGVVRDEREGIQWCAKAKKKYNQDKQIRSKSLIFMKAQQCQLLLNQGDAVPSGVLSSSENQEVMREEAKSTFDLGREFYEARNYQSAFQSFYEAARCGLPEAKYWLGICYYQGQGIKKDEREGIRLLFESADQDHIEAKLAIAHIYRTSEGRVIADDKEQWIYLYKEASKAGHPRVIQELVDYYINEDSYSRGSRMFDEKKIIEYNNWVRTLPIAELDATVIFKIGRFFLEEKFYNFNSHAIPHAEKILKKTAEMGYAPAQFELGMLYGNYEVRNPYSIYDSKKAIHFLELSMVQGERENLTADQIQKAKDKINYVNSTCIIL